MKVKIKNARKITIIRKEINIAKERNIFEIKSQLSFTAAYNVIPEIHNKIYII